MSEETNMMIVRTRRLNLREHGYDLASCVFAVERGEWDTIVAIFKAMDYTNLHGLAMALYTAIDGFEMLCSNPPPQILGFVRDKLRDDYVLVKARELIAW
jgi:hypothetical protein